MRSRLVEIIQNMMDDIYDYDLSDPLVIDGLIVLAKKFIRVLEEAKR